MAGTRARDLSPEQARALAPTASGRRGMTDEEQHLRQWWGFLHVGCQIPSGAGSDDTTDGDLFTPSHNWRHWNHFHVGMPLSREAR